MQLEDVVAQAGGVCAWSDLRQVASALQIRQAVDDGRLVRPTKGRYALAGIAELRELAEKVAGVTSHRSAALHYGWSVKFPPKHPEITFPRGRKLREKVRDLDLTRHWRTLAADEVVDGWVTSPVRTVVDCALDLPFDEALSVADSATRNGLDRQALLGAVAALSPQHRRKASGVLKHFSAEAENPFESVLRAICLGIPGLSLEVQHVIKDKGFYARVDIAEVALRIVIEAESLAHHADRDDLRRDCRRYTGLAGRGWVVLRFTWDEVMGDPDYVREAVRRTVEVRRRTAKAGRRHAT